MGSLTGVVASQIVPEAREGLLRLVGNQPVSAMAKASLTARGTPRAETKVGHSDPVAPIASWGWSRSQGYGCSPFKAVRELG